VGDDGRRARGSLTLIADRGRGLLVGAAPRLLERTPTNGSERPRWPCAPRFRSMSSPTWSTPSQRSAMPTNPPCANWCVSAHEEWIPSSRDQSAASRVVGAARDQQLCLGQWSTPPHVRRG
jgi:hypothetical protein